MNQPLHSSMTEPDHGAPLGTIVHLRSSTGMYGAEQVVLGLAREQGSRGWNARIAVFVHGGDADEPQLLLAARDEGLSAFGLRCRGIADPRCLADLRRLLLETRVDVLHCHDYKSIVYARLAARGLPVALVATLHGWLRDGLRLRAYRWLERHALRGFDRVCAVSPTIEHELLQAGLQRAAVVRVDNGIDIRRFRPAPRFADPMAPLRLGTAARLSPEKNLAQLIDAVAECRRRGRDLQLDILGDGPLRSELQQQVLRLGLAKWVRLRGGADELERWYPKLDAFVLPSLTEGMPMAVLEAMACGCPVLASAVGSVPTLLAGLPHSRTLPPGDFDALVEALMQVPALEAPRQDARERVRAHYSTARMADDYTAVYAAAVHA